MTSPHRAGVAAIMGACFLSALMGAAFFKAHLEDPGLSSFGGSFVRVIVSLVFVLLPLLFGRWDEDLLLSPARHRSLWLWGLFGALTVTSYFSAIGRIGNGLTALLGASSGVFIAVLSPLIAGQKTGTRLWVGIGGALAGMFMICSTTGFHGSRDGAIGCVLAVASGLFGALAYLMVARTRSRYSARTVMMTWSVSAIAAHLIVFCFSKVSFPSSGRVWIFLLGAGVAASFSQRYTTFAFQNAPAGLVASLSYLAPVLSLLVDALAFGSIPTARAGLGACMIVVFGAVLPLMRKV